MMKTVYLFHFCRLDIVDSYLKSILCRIVIQFNQHAVLQYDILTFDFVKYNAYRHNSI